MKKNWVLNSVSEESKTVASETELHPALVSILLRRGLKNASEIFHFLNPSLEHLESPFVFEDMKKAVDRIQSAIAKKEKILIYGDYDVDGVTGSAILWPILKKLGADVEVHIPHRIDDGYGLNRESLEKLFKKKFKLLITVDNGITGVEQIRFAQDSGVDVIVVDHHLPKEGLPPAYAIISAAGPSGKGDPHLAACGLAFKLGWALTGDFELVKEYLDLVTVGTIADLAEVTGENRILLKFGLPMLLRTNKPGLKALMEVAKVSRYSVSYRDIAFGLGPRINASGRMGSADNAFKLLTTDNPLLAENLAQILDEGNRERQRVEKEAYEEAVERVESDALAENQAVLVVDSAHWHEGVLGIIASRLVERYQLPSIVISFRGGLGKGSGRSVANFSLFDCVSKCADLLDTFGGHAQALGLSIKHENISSFRQRLNQAVLDNKDAAQISSVMHVDGELTLAELDAKFLRDLERLSPFGPGNKKPLFLTQGLRLRSQPKKRGQNTLHAWITDGEGKNTCELVGFRAFDRWTHSPVKPTYSLVYQPALKDFNGVKSIELQLEDWM